MGTIRSPVPLLLLLLLLASSCCPCWPDVEAPPSSTPPPSTLPAVCAGGSWGAPPVVVLAEALLFSGLTSCCAASEEDFTTIKAMIYSLRCMPSPSAHGDLICLERIAACSSYPAAAYSDSSGSTSKSPTTTRPCQYHYYLFGDAAGDYPQASRADPSQVRCIINTCLPELQHTGHQLLFRSCDDHYMYCQIQLDCLMPLVLDTTKGGEEVTQKIKLGDKQKYDEQVHRLVQPGLCDAAPPAPPAAKVVPPPGTYWTLLALASNLGFAIALVHAKIFKTRRGRMAI